ncbi:MAG: hypothetical protein FJ027_11485 [Candidatus Rokubacteria bacterium]|nr:hypothetical protein [Candidatus Rokubacteria bacterium]
MILQDRNAVIVARTRNEAEMVGRRIAANPTPGTEGWARSRLSDGDEVYVAFATAPFSGWRLVLGAPANDIDAPLLPRAAQPPLGDRGGGPHPRP